jgi:hypothetical protein
MESGSLSFEATNAPWKTLSSVFFCEGCSRAEREPTSE